MPIAQHWFNVMAWRWTGNTPFAESISTRYMATQIWVNTGSGNGLLLTAPSHYLPQYWLSISKVRWHSFDGDFRREASAINHESQLEDHLSWWRHQTETFSPVPAQRPVTRSFGVFFDLRLHKLLSKQLWGWWFDTPRSHYDVTVMSKLSFKSPRGQWVDLTHFKTLIKWCLQK